MNPRTAPLSPCPAGRVFPAPPIRRREQGGAIGSFDELVGHLGMTWEQAGSPACLVASRWNGTLGFGSLGLGKEDRDVGQV